MMYNVVCKLIGGVSRTATNKGVVPRYVLCGGAWLHAVTCTRRSTTGCNYGKRGQEEQGAEGRKEARMGETHKRWIFEGQYLLLSFDSTTPARPRAEGRRADRPTQPTCTRFPAGNVQRLATARINVTDMTCKGAGLPLHLSCIHVWCMQPSLLSPHPSCSNR